MITRARIYRHPKTDKWTTDIWGEPAVLSIMTNNVLVLRDGTTVGRWDWDTWNDARRFVFGEPYVGGRGLLVLRQRAWILTRRREMLFSDICMIPGCGCNGDPHP